jgi:sugar phosphate permease
MDEGSIAYRGWRVVAACFTMIFFGFGFGFYGHSVYLAALTTSDGSGAPPIAIGTVSTAVTAYYLAAAAIMVFISDLVAKLGPRLFATIGAVMMGLSLFFIAHIRSTMDLFVAYLAMAPAFAMLTNAAVANILAPWFTDKRGLAISLALTGGGVGGLAIVPSLLALSSKLSFPIALEVMAAGGLPVLLITIVLWMDRPPVQGGRQAAAEAGPPETSQPITRWHALKSAHYWTIAGPLTLAIMVQVGFIVHQVTFLLPVLGREGAGAAVLLTALTAAAGRVVIGFFIDRLDQRNVGAFLLAAQAIALLAMLMFASPHVALLASAVFGSAVGIMVTLPALIIQREYPPTAFGMLTALTLSIIQVGNALGPSLLGLLRDATGTYAAPIIVSMALEITAIAIILRRIEPAKIVSHGSSTS